jgi:peptide deformylase
LRVADGKRELMNLVYFPNQLLNTVSEEINPNSTTKEVNNIERLAKSMLNTMYANGGVGLAAIQIGVPLRIIVMDKSGDYRESPQIIINPKIKEFLDEPFWVDEGCLSFPGINEKSIRYPEVIIDGFIITTHSELLPRTHGDTLTTSEETDLMPDGSGDEIRKVVQQIGPNALGFENATFTLECKKLEPVTLQLAGLEAQICQHEINHLDGIHMASGWGRVKRDIIKRKIKKHLKHGT